MEVDVADDMEDDVADYMATNVANDVAFIAHLLAGPF